MGKILVIILIILWGILTGLYIIDRDWSFTNVSSFHFGQEVGINKTVRLLKGKNILGKFTANDNYLGVLSVRFETYERPSYDKEDVLLFRIREEGNSQWYYENTYRVGLIYDEPLYPFGFPVIANSKGKRYLFEISSLNGTYNNSVSIKFRNPVIYTKYAYPRRSIEKTPQMFLRFVIRKFLVSWDIDAVYSSIIFLQPLFFYLTISKIYDVLVEIATKSIKKILLKRSISIRYFNKHIFSLIKVILKKEWVLFGVLIVVSLIDILYLQLKNDWIYLEFLMLYIVLGLEYRNSSSILFYSLMISLVFAGIANSVGSFLLSEQFSIYGLLYLCAFIILQFKTLWNSHLIKLTEERK